MTKVVPTVVFDDNFKLVLIFLRFLYLFDFLGQKQRWIIAHWRWTYHVKGENLKKMYTYVVVAAILHDLSSVTLRDYPP